MFFNHTQRTTLVAILSAALSAFFATSAIAQNADDGALEEIIVTASKMGEESLQDTPIAITAFTGEHLSRSLMQDVRDLEASTPGLTISENTGFAQIYIRGVGSNNIFAGADPSSTIHMDGIYIGRPQASFNSFIDVERVEILRGPQGTLYGRNSVGGTINVISKAPSFDEADYKVQAAVGNEGFSRLEAYVNGPISDRVAGSIAVQKTDRGAFQENVVPGGNDLDDDDSFAIKAQLRFALSDDAEATLRFDSYEQDNAIYGYNTLLVLPPAAIAPLAASIFGDFRRVAAQWPHTYERDNYGISLDINWQINDTWSFRSLTGYRENDFFVQIDSDASDFQVLRTRLGEDSDQTSQEFNFTGNFDRLNVLFGAYYFQENILGTTGGSGISVFPNGIDARAEPDVDTSVWAVFSQITYDVTDRLTLIAGLRYTDETKDFIKNHRIFLLDTDIMVADLSFPLSTGEYSDVTPKVGLDYKVSDDVMFYASATKGFKSGGFNFVATLPPGGFDEESLWAYEVGLKSELADGKIRLNLAAFRYDYEDLQVQSFSGAGFVTVDNAATAEITGFEAELQAKPSPNWDLGVNVAWLNAEYESYPNAAISANLGGGFIADASGNTLNNSPELSGGLFAQYSQETSSGGSFYIRGEYQFKSEVFFTVENNDIERQDDYGLVNAFAGYTTADGQFSIELFGRNLADEEYVTSTGSFTLTPAGRVGWPVTYGIQLRYQK